MAAKSKQALLNGSRKVDNALQRVLYLPVVNSACHSLRKTYTMTKKSHPLVASVCEVYEKGLQGASSLAMWSVKLVVQKLEPQLAAANVLACQGLDHLEQTIPALHKPVEEVTSVLQNCFWTHVQSVMRSVADGLGRILGLAAESSEQAQNTMRDVAEDARSSRVSYLAEAGVKAAIGKVEKLMDLLPKVEHNSAHEDSGIRRSREASPSCIFGRLGALASNVFQHAYRQTTQAIRHTRDKGQEWAMWIPGLGGLARQSSIKAQQVFSDAQNTASGWLSKGQRKAHEKEEGRKEEDDGPRKMVESTQGLVGSLTQNRQAAYLSTISGVKEAPIASCNAAEQLLHLSQHKAIYESGTKVGMLWRILQNVISSFLGTIFHYMPVPRLSVKEEVAAIVKADGPQTCQWLESSRPVATHAQERGGHYQLRGEWHSNRGHHPLSFLSLDEPPLPQQATFQRRSPAFEADSAGARKSAFSPYKEVGSGRRLSEGQYRPSPEPAHARAHYAGLYGTILKKD